MTERSAEFKMMVRAQLHQDIRPISIRIRLREGGSLGPGKIRLMELIKETGSIAAAGRAMGMSYRRAWMLVQEVNGLFSEPVIMKHLGGAHGGGASLTSFGKEIVERFRRIESALSGAAAADIEALQDAAKGVIDS